MALLAVALTLGPSVSPGQQGITILLRVHTQSGVPVAGAELRAERGSEFVIETRTDPDGRARFGVLVAGEYHLSVKLSGFQPMSQVVVLVAQQPETEIEFALLPMLEHNESIDVHASSPSDVEYTPAATDIRPAEVKSLPSRPATVADTLPLIPGINRTPDGEIQMSGTGEHRSALVVNAIDVTDPATGRFDTTVPIDSVESLDVFQTPFLAQYGRFTSGVVAVETKRGGDKWHFELNDPFPDFRIRSWRLRGLRDASPRINFGGPLIANKLYFTEGVEYNLVKTPVRTLPFPVQ